MKTQNRPWRAALMKGLGDDFGSNCAGAAPATIKRCRIPVGHPLFFYCDTRPAQGTGRDRVQMQPCYLGFKSCWSPNSGGGIGYVPGFLLDQPISSPR